MINVSIIGASGYTGVELIKMLIKHNEVNLQGLYVSQNSADANKEIANLHGVLQDRCKLKLNPLSDVEAVAKASDVVFLATDHKTSHDLAPIFVTNNCVVFDLSGAFRVNEQNFYTKYYGFEHEHQELLANAYYALCEYSDIKLMQQSKLISLPGCYPTASQLALRPLFNNDLLDTDFAPVINATSGVSGAGRKASLTNSFCEVSLNAYGIFTHRHLPEIEKHVGHKVIFNPHLGFFKRGILATITAKANNKTNLDSLKQAYDYYKDKKLVRVKNTAVKLGDVVNTPFCDISYAYNDGYIVVCSAIDNLLKGASAQAIQAFNLYFGFDETKSLF